MKKVIFILSITVFMASSCRQAANKQPKVVNESAVITPHDTSPQNSISEKTKEQDNWNFIVSPPNVGLISTKDHIAEVPDLLPTDYSMSKDSTVFGQEGEDEDDWKYTVYYAVSKNNKTVFEIFPKENSDEIYSIVVLNPEYKIENTELHVGSTFGTLKKTFTIKDTYFSYTDGLYIYCNEFDGAFSIDIEGQGDEYGSLASLASLPDSRKIKAIIVY